MPTDLQVTYLFAGLLLGFLGGVAVMYLGYRWGCFAGLKARAQNSPKWQAYLVALLPPASFAFAFLFDPYLSGAAPETFMALAAPAAIGTCIRLNRRRMAGI